MSSKVKCRCCLTWSADKDLMVRNKWLGETEVYADMLKECYDIEIKMCTKPTDRGICFSCILRLRDALAFKRKVLKCLKEFENHLQNGPGVIKDDLQAKYFKPIQIKQEDIEVEIEADDSKKQNDTEDFCHDLKEECSDQDNEEDDKSLALLAKDQLTKRQATTKEVTTKNLLKVKATNLEIKRIVRKPVNVATNSNDLTEISIPNTLAALKHNISKIMKYSNVTPFFTVTYGGIECADCKETQKDLATLKLHNTTHDNMKYDLLNKNNATRHPIKLDITDLKCNLCDQNIDVVSNLKKHLTDKHAVKFYDVKDIFLEFKLSCDGKFNCALCSSSFETFKMLQQHMNGHYRNYICDECGSGFLNQHQLAAHKNTHSKKEFKCSHCDKVFNTKDKRYMHVKNLHSSSKKRFTAKCPLCSESFTGYYKRNSHMMKVHKTSPADYRCNICDRTFVMKADVTKHIKRDHLMEKKHICEECGMQFYSKKCLNDHMVKHKGLKIFKCSVCTKSYTRQKVLKEHMRIHLNDRRFKCGLCELAFVQKCSLKGHMLSNHGISLSEYEKTDQSEPENSSSVISG